LAEDGNYGCTIRNKAARAGITLNLIADHDEDYTDLNITRLTFDSCQISTVPSEVFEKFPQIKNLYLNGQQVQSIPNNAFGNASNLEYLRLDSNQIFVIGDLSFKGADNLKTLLLNKNSIVKLGENSFATLKKLEKIDLSENNINNLPEVLFRSQENLKELYLSNNQISILPAKIFNALGNLVTLNLHQNQLSFLPGTLFGNNLQLKTIGFNNNRLNGISSTMFQHLRELEVVDFNYNQCINNYYSSLQYSNYMNNFMTALQDRCSFGYLQVEMKSMIENYAKMTQYFKSHETKIEKLEKKMENVSAFLQKVLNYTEVQSEEVVTTKKAIDEYSTVLSTTEATPEEDSTQTFNILRSVFNSVTFSEFEDSEAMENHQDFETAAEDYEHTENIYW
jgi:Leucine-rich repeat (LRR) protein